MGLPSRPPRPPSKRVVRPAAASTVASARLQANAVLTRRETSCSTKRQDKWEFVSARKVAPTSDYEGLHVVKWSYAVARGEVRVAAIDFLLISKRLISKSALFLDFSLLF